MSSDKFPITAAQLAGNFCETLFFGIYLVTCTVCARALLLTGNGREERWLRPHEIRWTMLGATCILFAISTFDVAIGLLHNFHAFIESDNPEAELLNIADWINIARSVNQAIATILSNFVLIYRCWIVHDRRWMVIVPSLILYLGGIAMAIKLVEVEANPETEIDVSLDSSNIRVWWIAFFGTMALQNVLNTAILIWRIWRVENQSEKYMHGFRSRINWPRLLRKIIRVIAESGAAYTMMVFITFLVSVTESNALYPTSDMTIQAAGIAFNVIVVRSSAKRDQQFIDFDHNKRIMTNPDSSGQRTVVSTALGSNSFRENIHLKALKRLSNPTITRIMGLRRLAFILTL